MARARPDDLSAMRTQSDFLNEPGSSQDVGPRAAAVRETTRYLSPRNSATDGRSDPSNSNELPNASLNRHERVTRTLTMPTPETAPHIGQSQMPSIRFLPHHDPRASRPSLNFVALSRVLPSDQAIIKVGRYSEKDTDPNNVPGAPSAAPLGFKSKVVSRRHCELWCQSGQWYIKDVKSSSGTFLNHIRLSQPNLESKPFPLNDGDVVQLGIDFKGGAEMIFRCVKIRVECNRGWQKALNHFNTTTHRHLRDLAAKKFDKDAAHSSECSICLLSIAPCQSLFVAPCSHVWHYKCIRPILNGPTWPTFLCPNCRAVADLEAEVEEPLDDWEEDPEELDAHASHDENACSQPCTPPAKKMEPDKTRNQSLEHRLPPLEFQQQDSPEQHQPAPEHTLPLLETEQLPSQYDLTHAYPNPPLDSENDQEQSAIIDGIAMANEIPRNEGHQIPPSRRVADDVALGLPRPSRPSFASRKLDSVKALDLEARPQIAGAAAILRSSHPETTSDVRSLHDQTLTASQSTNSSRQGDHFGDGGIPGVEGPLTPRNDAGPFIFDGSAGRASGAVIFSGATGGRHQSAPHSNLSSRG